MMTGPPAPRPGRRDHLLAALPDLAGLLARGERLVLVPEMLARYAISLSTFRRWHRAGRFPPAVRLGRRLAFLASAVDAHLKGLAGEAR
jgi:predicted DNA-binding transcriptional regulator AlpA